MAGRSVAATVLMLALSGLTLGAAAQPGEGVSTGHGSSRRPNTDDFRVQDQAASNRTRSLGLSVGAFFFASGLLRPGIAFDLWLDSTEGRDFGVSAWSALLPGGGTAVAVGARLGSGIVRAGLGVAAFKTSGQLGIGPGVQFGIGTPARSPNSSFGVRATYEGYVTNDGYTPVLRLTVGRVG